MWPFVPIVISQKFNNKDSYGPGLNHEGIDCNRKGTSGNQDLNTPILAIKPGEIVHISSKNTDYGTLVVCQIDYYGKPYFVRYCHLNKVSVSIGQSVSVGQEIGLMGSTGNSTASHLHLDILKKRPSNWRLYSKNVLEWFIDPEIVINDKGVQDMAIIYENIEGFGFLDTSKKELVDKFINEYQEERKRLKDEKDKTKDLTQKLSLVDGECQSLLNQERSKITKVLEDFFKVTGISISNPSFIKEYIETVLNNVKELQSKSITQATNVMLISQLISNLFKKEK